MSRLIDLRRDLDSDALTRIILVLIVLRGFAQNLRTNSGTDTTECRLENSVSIILINLRVHCDNCYVYIKFNVRIVKKVYMCASE